MVNHVVSTKCVIVIAHLSLYFPFLKHPVTVSIVVTALRFKFYFFNFLCMALGNIRYKQILFHGISSYPLAGDLPYFLFGLFVCWKESKF